MKKFEQVSSDEHNLSVAGGRCRCPCLMSRGRGVGAQVRSPGEAGKGTIPCDLSHDAYDVPTPYTLNRMTDACKNITFPQLHLRAVINDFMPPSAKQKSIFLYLCNKPRITDQSKFPFLDLKKLSNLVKSYQYILSDWMAG